MNSPLVSIIIPTYNRAHLIGETLDSILAQTYQNWECIVVDDGSTDNTEEVVLKYVRQDKRFQFYKRPDGRPKGGNAARNYGFEKSKGEYINWFDSDDLMLPNKLAVQINHLNESDCNLSVCQTYVFEGTKDNILGLRKEKVYSKDFFNDFITNEIKWLTQAPVLKRKFIIDEKIDFDETLQQSQERDFFVKVLNKTKDYIYTEEPLVLFRKHEKSISHGEFTYEKAYSTFKVNYTILNENFSKLNSLSIKVLKRAVKASVFIALQNDENDLAKKIRNILLRDKNFSNIERIKIVIGFYSILFFKKGEIFFK